MTLRILVGTLYSSESEFWTSRDSIWNQKNCKISQFVVQDLDEYRAHNLLWKTFNFHKSNHDMIVKVDADTVLNPDDLFEVAYAGLSSSAFAGIQLPLLDYFSQTMIYGIGFFSPKVVFRESKHVLFADRSINRKRHPIGRETDIGFAGLAGFHCLNPTIEQSFRYGLHRMKKRQYDLLSNVYKVWKSDLDELKGWALAGAIAAMNEKEIGINYKDADFQFFLRELRVATSINEWVHANSASLDPFFFPR